MKKVLILSAICLFALCGCGKIPKLANGEEAVITFKKDGKEHSISADELYELLKNNYGVDAVTNLLDKYILETEFPEYADSAKKEADSTVEALKLNYKDKENELLSLLQIYYGLNSVEAYGDFIYINSLRTHALDEYAKLQVSDKDIENYYNKEAKGDIEVYHILVTPKVTDGMSEDDQKKAEEDAKNTINEIIKKLNDSKDALTTFKELVKEYSEDESTNQKDGNLGFINYYQLSSEYDELIDAAYKLKNGEYSTKLITTKLGYHVIYRNDSKEKDTLENLKDEILDILADRVKEDDDKASIHALKYYRDNYNMKIIDSELNNVYGKNLNSQLNAQSAE